MDNLSLQKPSNALTETDQPSSKDLELLRLLDMTAAVTGKEFLPAEGRFWQQELNPEPQAAIEWAFREHLRNSKFFPKPAEILELVAEWKRQVYDTKNDYTPIARKAVEAEQSTPEWEEASRRAREALKRMVAKLDQTKGMSK